jgi:hypothetical protein
MGDGQLIAHTVQLSLQSTTALNSQFPQVHHSSFMSAAGDSTSLSENTQHTSILLRKCYQASNAPFSEDMDLMADCPDR